MTVGTYLYFTPLWVVSLGLLAVLLVSVETGYRLGLWWQRRTPEVDLQPGSDISLTALYGLLGLVLAFTYSFTVSRAEQRKMAVVNEANAIGTAFLRAGLVEEPLRTRLRSALLEYGWTRVGTRADMDSADKWEAFLARTVEAQASLWPLAEEVVAAGGRGPVEALVVGSVNEVLDSHTVRLMAAYDRLPPVILGMLTLVAAVSLSISGYNRGLLNTMNRVRMTALAGVLAAVMSVIMDFDRSQEGGVTLDLGPTRALLLDMERMMAVPP